MLDFIVNTFILFFVVIDPVGVTPIFAALTHGGTDEYRRRMAIKGTLLAGAVLLLFVFGGNYVFNALGIGLDAFRIAGGILLFLIAMDMVFAAQSGIRSTTTREREEASARADISVFPVAIPLIAGPGAFTTVLLMIREYEHDVLYITVGLIVVALVLLLTLGALLMSSRIMRLIGETGANVIGRVLGIMLASLAVQFIIDGIAGSLELG